ncbi:putative CopG family transcriptional regulator [Thermoproteus uzoniensis 768-20]|uniref:CopG family transcriptional regulator n=1 Tax=Thermoproteus uzoniensis (strain 768-20) TaxID=999630 RepID=F2L4P8_THEU7|nr:ribbon-helix-helix domain-containing protein [Thermoproteus uzoniensis]AEA12226.1 putative CopG family transcriptional regulator [Thermoproteus uzoniensis 768-20]
MGKRGERRRKYGVRRLAVVSVYLTEEHIRNLDALVKLGLFRSRSDVVETALEDLLYRYNVKIDDEDIEAIRGR